VNDLQRGVHALPRHDNEEFDGIELCNVVVTRDTRDGTEDAQSVHTQEDYQYIRRRRGAGRFLRVEYTVYGHLAKGGVQALADCATISDARLIGVALSLHWGVPITYDFMFKPNDLKEARDALRDI
jgi:hypothetical protein